MRRRAYSATGPFTSGDALAARNSGLFVGRPYAGTKKACPEAPPKK